MSKAPQWALDLVERVCTDYKRRAPELTWRESKDRYVTYKGDRIKVRDASQHSSGRTKYPRGRNGQKLYKRSKSGRLVKYKGGISLTAGTLVHDQRLVLLHELAHWLCVKRKNQGHTREFWETAFDLYENYGVDMEYAYEREKDYKATARTVYANRTKNN